MPRQRKLITKRQEASIMRDAERRAEAAEREWEWHWWRPGRPLPGTTEALARRARVAVLANPDWSWVGAVLNPNDEEPLP